MSDTKISGNRHLYSCWCKRTDKADAKPTDSFRWGLTWWSEFRIAEDRIQSGDWVIPYSEVKKATFYRTKKLLMSYRVLHIETADRSFLFLFTHWARPDKHLNMDFTEEKMEPKSAPITIAIRLAALGFITYELWKRFVAS